MQTAPNIYFDTQSFANDLSDVRRKHGLRKTEAARRLGINAAYFTQLESRPVAPTAHILAKLCMWAGLDPRAYFRVEVKL